MNININIYIGIPYWLFPIDHFPLISLYVYIVVLPTLRLCHLSPAGLCCSPLPCALVPICPPLQPSTMGAIANFAGRFAPSIFGGLG